MKHLESWLKRMRVFSDLSAWFLIAPALAVLWFIDAPTAKALLQWSMFGIVMAGVGVMVSRLVFPDLHLNDFLKRAYNGGIGAAIVSASVILFVGIVFLGLIVWAKPL
jgi:multisubunit Na+/H+ antiporter MnhB subunit